MIVYARMRGGCRGSRWRPSSATSSSPLNGRDSVDLHGRWRYACMHRNCRGSRLKLTTSSAPLNLSYVWILRPSFMSTTAVLHRFSPQKGKTKLQRETERIEEQFRRKKEEKVRKMLERLSSEQRARVASLIQKHSQQMLELIAEKLTSLEVRLINNNNNNRQLHRLSYFVRAFTKT